MLKHKQVHFDEIKCTYLSQQGRKFELSKTHDTELSSPIKPPSINASSNLLISNYKCPSHSYIFGVASTGGCDAKTIHNTFKIRNLKYQLIIMFVENLLCVFSQRRSLNPSHFYDELLNSQQWVLISINVNKRDTSILETLLKLKLTKSILTLMASLSCLVSFLSDSKSVIILKFYPPLSSLY